MGNAGTIEYRDVMVSYSEHRWHDVLTQLAKGIALPLGVDPDDLLFIGHHAAIELGVDVTENIAYPATSRTLRQNLVFECARRRVLDLCVAGDFSRVEKIVSAMAARFSLIGMARRSLTEREEALPSRSCQFLDHLPVSLEALPTFRAAAPNLSIVLAITDLSPTNSEPYGVGPALAASAAAFGFPVAGLEPHWRYLDQERFLTMFRTVLEEQRPALVVYDNIFEVGEPSQSAANRRSIEQVCTLLQDAQRRWGTKVVNAYYDLWMGENNEILQGLGSVVDFIHDMVPHRVFPGFEIDSTTRLCFPHPTLMPEPTVALGSNPRGIFIGGIEWYNIARLCWWDEAVRRQLPLDVLLTRYGTNGTWRSYQDFANAIAAHQATVNFSRRETGVRIMTGRAMETLLIGGALLEEEGGDTRYFLAPDIHYRGFQTIDELEALLATGPSDEKRVRRIAREGKAWAETYYTGDVFWASLLAKLFF